jgi:hypothetical protein
MYVCEIKHISEQDQSIEKSQYPMQNCRGNTALKNCSSLWLNPKSLILWSVWIALPLEMIPTFDMAQKWYPLLIWPRSDTLLYPLLIWPRSDTHFWYGPEVIPFYTHFWYGPVTWGKAHEAKVTRESDVLVTVALVGIVGASFPFDFFPWLLEFE